MFDRLKSLLRAPERKASLAARLIAVPYSFTFNLTKSAYRTDRVATPKATGYRQRVFGSWPKRSKRQRRSAPRGNKPLFMQVSHCTSVRLF